MPALKDLYINYLQQGIPSGDLNKKWRFENNRTSLQGNGLSKLVLSGTSELNQNGLVQLLDWILPSSSQTLRELLVSDGAKIDSIPLQLSLFKRLEKLTIENNKVNMTIYRADPSICHRMVVSGLPLSSSHQIEWFVWNQVPFKV